jgi:hypothetical protein
LVSDRNQVEQLAKKLSVYVPTIKRAWQQLGCILLDDCRIHSKRFLRGVHNALLPFVLYLSTQDQLSNEAKKKLIIGIYLCVMSGVFSSAEARMEAFARKKITGTRTFPLQELISLVKREYGIKSLDDMLRRHLDLALNIAHGGITLDGNPEELQRDHIFPKSQLEKAGYPYEIVNHYANFHFLRACDNLNKLDKPPHEWFRNPGRDVPPYSERDLEERLLTWDDLEPGHFEPMIKNRGEKIRKKAEELFGLKEEEFNALFAEPTAESTFELQNVFPVIADSIEELFRIKRDFVTREEIVQALSDHPTLKNLLGAPHHPGERVASNMVAWFSQKITVGDPKYKEVYDRFERKKIGNNWAYKPKQER